MNVILLIALGLGAGPELKDCPIPPAGFPRFKVQEIASDFKIGYAVHICDVDGDQKPDIVVVDKERVVWYENPTWKMRTILKGKTKPDNVCICSLDIDGDKKIDFVLGAGWRPTDTKTPGTLQWLRRGKTLDDEWEMFPIPCDEPTVHRVRSRSNGIYKGFAMAPLMGLGATKDKNWIDGRAVRVMDYTVPEVPTVSENWKPVIVSEDLHVVHNFFIGYAYILCYASYEGVSFLESGKKTRVEFPGDQTNPKSTRGASEVTKLFGHYATIEPWHGNQIVVYGDGRRDEKTTKRTVIDDHLRWGHAIHGLHCLAEEDGEQKTLEWLVAGVRDNPDPKQGDKFTEQRGVRLYRAKDAKGEKWERYILEDGGVAVEDLQVADLNGDGKPEIIAVGRATQNCRIYWNQGK